MDDLLPEIRKFCKRHEMSVSDFGSLALNDRPFVGQLEGGRDVRLSTVRKVRDWMADYDRERAANA